MMKCFKNIELGKMLSKIHKLAYITFFWDFKWNYKVLNFMYFILLWSIIGKLIPGLTWIIWQCYNGSFFGGNFNLYSICYDSSQVSLYIIRHNFQIMIHNIFDCSICYYLHIFNCKYLMIKHWKHSIFPNLICLQSSKVFLMLLGFEQRDDYYFYDITIPTQTWTH